VIEKLSKAKGQWGEENKGSRFVEKISREGFEFTGTLGILGSG